MQSRFDRPKPRRNSPSQLSLYAVGVLLLIVVAGLVFWAYVSTRTTLECTVTGKDRSISISTDADGKTSSKTDQRVYTDCGVFKVEDSLYPFNVNSADTYGQLLEDHRYSLDVIGWRNGFFSVFQNVTSAEEISR